MSCVRPFDFAAIQQAHSCLNHSITHAIRHSAQIQKQQIQTLQTLFQRTMVLIPA
jgi:hypothetical protein